MESERIVVANIGMVASLGLDAYTCCAASRALISRATTIDWFNPGSGREWGSEPLAGHAVHIATGFTGLGKAVALGSLALRDLMSRVHFSAEDLHSTGFFLNLSDKHYEDASTDDRMDCPPYGTPPPLPSIAWRERTADLIPRLAKTCEWTIPQKHQRLFYGGHAGFVQALDAAVASLNDGSLSGCIVGGIDSLVEPAALQAAHAQGDLKAEGRSVGFMPGEAAAFLLLRKGSPSNSSRAPVLSKRATASVDAGENNRAKSAAAGKALARAISSVMPEEPSLFLGDLNGVESRAAEWGYAAVYLTSQFKNRVYHDFWAPALHFGDVGAAAGAVAACLGVRAIERGYARARNVVIWLSSGSGLTGAFRIDQCN